MTSPHVPWLVHVYTYTQTCSLTSTIHHTHIKNDTLYQKIESSQVSIGRQMYTLYMYNGIFFNLKKECSSNTYYNIDES